jgi:hypothetical protein
MRKLTREQAIKRLADIILQPEPLKRLREVAADKTNPVLAKYAQQYIREIES